MKIVKPGDPDFDHPQNPFRDAVKRGHAQAPDTHAAPEVALAVRHLLRALAGQHPEVVPHLAVGGTILIGTNSHAVIELPFSGIAGLAS